MARTTTLFETTDWTEERRSVWLTSALGRALVIFAECPIRADRQLVFLRLETLLQASGTIPDTRSFSSLQRANAGKPQPANERPEKRQQKKKKA